MARRYRSNSRYSSARSWVAIEHIRAYRELESRLGPLVEDVRIVFFQLPTPVLDVLLQEYESKYGYKAAEYARETMPLWKGGQRQMAGQTMERLLNLVPKYLQSSDRYNLVKKLCAHVQTENQIHRSVTVDLNAPDEGLQQFRHVLTDFQEQRVLKYIPEHVLEIATWLSDEDVTVARHLLANVDQAVTAQVIQTAQAAEGLVRGILNRSDTERYQEVFRFPTGTLTLSAHRPSACFIANAVFEGLDHPTVASLRQFRDTQLVGSRVGEFFVYQYYRFSPATAIYLRRHPVTRTGMRLLLTALVWVGRGVSRAAKGRRYRKRSRTAC